MSRRWRPRRGWIDSPGRSGTPSAPVLVSLGGDLVASEPDRNERAGFSPELIAVAVVVVTIGRRWPAGIKMLSKRRAGRRCGSATFQHGLNRPGGRAVPGPMARPPESVPGLFR